MFCYSSDSLKVFLGEICGTLLTSW